jgi:hypothetical protein
MDRRLRRAAFGAASCAAAAFLSTLFVDEPDQPVGAQIVVPKAQDFESDKPTPPPSSVSIPLPSPSVGTAGSASTPSNSERRLSLVTQPKPPVPAAAPKQTVADFQAEHAWIHRGRVAADHSGFTGSGFVDYDTVSGGSIEWTVTTAAAGGADVVFRFANGSPQARLAAISVNGVLVGYAYFPVTNGWSDWRTVTVHTDLPAGTTRIKATAMSENGGPNIDKITLVSPA